MKPWLKILIVLAVVGAVYFAFESKRTQAPVTQTSDEEIKEQAEVVVETPQRGDLVTSPLLVKGKARGTWFFEANLPVTLKDQDGKILAQKGFMANPPAGGDWMTEDYVEFEDSLTFTAPTTEFGVLIIQNDNPSGLEENEKSFAVPVRFK